MIEEISFDSFQRVGIRDLIPKDKSVAIIGSRSAKDQEMVMKEIWKFSKGVSLILKCLIISGGAYGSDQAGMEGALGLKLHALNPVIPVSSRNIKKFVEHVERMSHQDVEWNEKECTVKTRRLVVLYPDFSDGYHPSKYHQRDRKIADWSDVVVAFWDGKSKGTKATMNYGEKKDKKMIVVRI